MVVGLRGGRWFANFPSCLSGFVVGVTTLILILGAPSAMGLAVMTVCLIINRMAAARSKKVTQLDLQATEMRLNVMREMIGSMTQVCLPITS